MINVAIYPAQKTREKTNEANHRISQEVRNAIAVNIGKASDSGLYETTVPYIASQMVVDELVQLGYKVKTMRGQYNEDSITKVSW